MERRGAGGEGGVEERGGGRPHDEKMGDGSVRMMVMVVAVIVVGAIVAREYKDAAATLSKYLWRGRKTGRGRGREREVIASYLGVLINESTHRVCVKGGIYCSLPIAGVWQQNSIRGEYLPPDWTDPLPPQLPQENGRSSSYKECMLTTVGEKQFVTCKKIISLAHVYIISS